jgi:hypothetical protein
MSKISLSGNASGTGTFTIASPNSNTDRTLTLPDNTGTLVTQNSQPAFASTIGVGGATPSASGAGITFPATQVASTDAKTLDDYEEGTFTITPTGTSASITGTWTAATCSYVKIGKTVTVTIPVNGTSFGFTSLTGYYLWTGLPFQPSASAGGVFATFSISTAVVWHVFLSVTDVWFYAPLNTNTTAGGTATVTYSIA